MSASNRWLSRHVGALMQAQAAAHPGQSEPIDMLIVGDVNVLLANGLGAVR